MNILSSLLFKDYRRRVLELLLLHTDESFHVREIARLTGTVAGTLHKELTKLAAAGILVKNVTGNQVRYRANPDCLIFEELKQIIEKTSENKPDYEKEKMDVIVVKHRQKILSLAKKNGIRNVRVFGSMARNEANPDSDLDLLVELEEGSSGFALGGFLHDVSNLVHRKVDVVTEKSLHPSLREKVLHEANVL